MSAEGPSRASLGPTAASSTAQDADEEYEEVIEEFEEEEEIEEDEESWTSGSYDEETDEEMEAENLLSFSTFPVEGLQGQHIMVAVAFNRFIVIGTNRGLVALVEVTAGTLFRLLNKHIDPISDVSCDLNEEYVGSSDKAGVITVQNLYDERDTYRKEFDVPMQSIALHPRYARNEDRPIVVAGGDRVVLIHKTMFLGHRKSTVLQERRGKVYLVRWCGTDVLAWANDRGVQLYSYSGRAMIQLVARPSDSPRSELYRCSLVWEPPRTLLCGWGDWVQEMQLHELRMEERLRWGTEFMSRTHRVEVAQPIRTNTLREPYRVCGVAPFGANRLLVLACLVEQEGCVLSLEVRIVERATFMDIYRGRLQSKYKHSLQYSLSFSPGMRESGAGMPTPPQNQQASKQSQTREQQTQDASSSTALTQGNNTVSGSSYYIVCVDAVIKATPCDEDDHVEYLLRTNRLEDAYEYACGHQLHRHSAETIGGQLLQFLFAQQQYKALATRLSTVLGVNYAEWERWIYQFDQQGVSDLLVDVLPLGEESNEVQIDEKYYELVLLRCLEKDVLRFQSAVRRFKGLFKGNTVCRAAELRYREWRQRGVAGRKVSNVSDEEFRAIGDTYGLLLRLGGRNEEALQILLQVDLSNELFHFIREKRLFMKANELLPELFSKNEDKTIELLLECVHEHDEEDGDTTADISALTGESEVKKNSNSNNSNTLPKDNDNSNNNNDNRHHSSSGNNNNNNSNNNNKSISSSNASLSPKAVVHRLERTQRQYLWAYLKALQTFDRTSHATVCRTRAQLVATLFIENESRGLMPFLHENSAYLPRIKEIYALCRKHQLLEETVFLLARMGREDEGLRIIVHDMKNMKKAVQFIADIPNEEEQVELYYKLVHMALEVNASLHSRNGEKYFEHPVTEGQTWATIAKKYGIDEATLRTANHHNDASSGVGRPVVGSVCIVPLNLMQALLEAVVDPSVRGRVALDPAYVVKHLPENEPMPHIGTCIAAVACSKADDVRLMEAVVQVATSDLGRNHDTLYRRRAASLRVEPGASLCPFCRQPVTATDVVVFGCAHAYHASCVLDCIAGEDVLCVDPGAVDLGKFLQQPEEYLKPGAHITTPRCLVCVVERDVRK